MIRDRSVQSTRQRVLHNAPATRNVSATRRGFGLGCTVFYGWRLRSLRCLTEGVRPTPGRGGLNRPPRVDRRDDRWALRQQPASRARIESEMTAAVACLRSPITIFGDGNWGAMKESNLLPPPCSGGALPMS